MNDERRKNILLIGGSVFVGKTIAEYLLQKGNKVTLLNRGTHPIPGTRQLTADRNLPEEVQRAASGADVHYDAIIDTSAFNGEQTRIAWEEFSSKTDHWLHLSSASVYSDANDNIPNENAAIGGAEVWGSYGRDKSACDLFLTAQSGGPAITIFRPPYIYGPGNNHDRETFIWSRALRGRSVLVPSDGKTQIQFVHAKDLAAAFVRALGRDFKQRVAVYNIGTSERFSLREWVSGLCAVAKVKDNGICVGQNASKYSPRQYFPFRDFPCVVDVTRIGTELGWKPIFGFTSGFENTLAACDAEFLKNKPIETAIEDEILKLIS
ncbi:MAG: NAD-dependent epimerase/dehydratase family protein [Alphaproteobacteria bacterium]|nr:NAD-dependent epimerase/dehydratase family protein [Alphaproteobacteria bacterium]